MTLDYEILKLIWWLLIGILLISFAITDGFDLGVGALIPFVGQSDEERRVLLNAVGPTWESNQVWLVTAVGALFAAWPLVYATAFSSFYFVLLLALGALFLRPVGFDYRSKLPNPRWRNAWDWGLFIGGVGPAFMFGIAVGNLFEGVPFYFDTDLRSYYTGSFLALLNPFALLTGIVSLSMLVMHGAVYLQLKTEDVIANRCQKAVIFSASVFLIGFITCGSQITFNLIGYQIETIGELNRALNPLDKSVYTALGAWMVNYQRFDWLWAIPTQVFLFTVLTVALSKRGKPGLAFITSSISIAGVIATVGLSLYPFLLPSSTHPDHSLTIWDSGSSFLTLKVLFWVTLFFVPIVITYTSWVYRILKGKVSVAKIRENQHTAY